MPCSLMSTFVGYTYRFVRHELVVSNDDVPVACSPNGFARYTLTREQGEQNVSAENVIST